MTRPVGEVGGGDIELVHPSDRGTLTKRGLRDMAACATVTLLQRGSGGSTCRPELTYGQTPADRHLTGRAALRTSAD